MTKRHETSVSGVARRRWVSSLAIVAGLGVAAVAPAAEARPAASGVPDTLKVPAGHALFLRTSATGTQNYVCLPTSAGPGYAWTFFGPQATLFKARVQVITHFLSPNPDEAGQPRPTWQHSRDTSRVWGNVIASSSDPKYVKPGAIPWLLLQVVGSERGTGGGAGLTETAYIQRIGTSGGVAPASGCDDPTDVGTKALVPYTTEYLFYKPAHP